MEAGYEGGLWRQVMEVGFGDRLWKWVMKAAYACCLFIGARK